jgi:hypothetical protein
LTAFAAALLAKSEVGKRFDSSRRAAAASAVRFTLLTAIHEPPPRIDDIVSLGIAERNALIFRSSRFGFTCGNARLEAVGEDHFGESVRQLAR